MPITFEIVTDEYAENKNLADYFWNSNCNTPFSQHKNFLKTFNRASNTTIEYQAKRQTLCTKRPNQNINNLENSFNSSYLRILKCLENKVCSVSYCIVNTSDCITSIQNLIQFFVIVKLSLSQLWLSKGSLLELSLSIEVSFRCDWA